MSNVKVGEHIDMHQSPAEIRIENLTLSFEDNKVLDGINLELKQGENLVILGENGSGKSVLLKCILGLLPIDDGKIFVKGIDITQMSAAEREDILSPFGVLFQYGALFDSLTALENVAFGLIQGFGMNKAEAQKIALEKLKDVGIYSFDSYPAELSGGMQRRVALARALANSPTIVFLDSPTTGLDPILTGIIDNLINQLVVDKGVSAITLTHDIKSVRKIASRVAFLFNGKIIWTGSVSEMDKADNPYVSQFIKRPFGKEIG